MENGCSLLWPCAFCLQRDYIQVVVFPPSSKTTKPVCSVRPDPALAARVGRAALSPRSCSKMRDLSLFSQQAWPTGTQQILIPSSWQQVPGVAIHSSAHQSAVAESPLETHDGSSQQGHIWRSVDWTLHTQEPRWFPAVMSG